MFDSVPTAETCPVKPVMPKRLLILPVFQWVEDVIDRPIGSNQGLVSRKLTGGAASAHSITPGLKIIVRISHGIAIVAEVHLSWANGNGWERGPLFKHLRGQDPGTPLNIPNIGKFNKVHLYIPCHCSSGSQVTYNHMQLYIIYVCVRVY